MLTSYCAAKGEAFCQRAFFAGLLSPPCLWLLCLAIRKLRTVAAIRLDSKPRGLKVVIQGSSRGLGLALARQFLSLGDDVVISSRDEAAVQSCVQELQREFPGRRVVAAPADAAQPAQVEALAATAAQELGRIDVWVANAGLSASRKAPVAETSAQELVGIVNANLTGALLAAKAALPRLAPGGKFFLVDGSGSNGRPTAGNAAYGATKRALVQLKDSLAAEARGTGVGVHIFSPGMVATDLLLRYADNPRSARFINILAEDPAVVAKWLVPRLRGVKGSGCYIRFLTMAGVLWRFVTARKRRGRFVPEGPVGGYERLAGQEARQ
ncbi:hypothetical protein ABPG77_010401 [Micractinium sp. CCAP 211/92]